MDGDSDATDTNFTLQIMRALDIVRGGNWENDDNDEEKKNYRQKRIGGRGESTSLVWHKKCRTNGSSKSDNRETLIKHKYLF